jgi:type IV pilus assembly protein PilE
MKRPTTARRPLSLGFTLIELMIVVALVAILAAIAYPSFMDSVRRGWRAEARTALMQEMQQQERVFTQRARYRTNPVHKKFSGDSDAGSKYDIVVGACDGRDDTGQCIRLTANLRAGFTDPAVRNIWIESAGLKGCDGDDESRCWQ